MTDRWLIVGLGNPGPEYAATRHNIGQMVLDELAQTVGGNFKKHSKARAQVLEGRLGLGGPRVVLAKPLTYMNLSGGPVAALANFYGVAPEEIIVVHDELDIPFDSLKLIAQAVFEATGHSAERVTPVTTADYFAAAEVFSPRPTNSAMDLSKIIATGFTPRDHREAMAAYLA